MEIDVYDFDKTIVPFDSGTKFILYCALHYPWTILFAPVQIVGIILAFMKVINFTQYKRFAFAFVTLIPLKKAVKGFWDKHDKDVHKWFYERKRHSVVISASPDFLLKEIQERLGFEDLLCSRHSAKTGALIGENCRGEEKVRRLYELYNKEDIRVIDVYSDSIENDTPIFSLATNNCYHIVKSERIKFNLTDSVNV